jgi:hypothetical protein
VKLNTRILSLSCPKQSLVRISVLRTQPRNTDHVSRITSSPEQARKYFDPVFVPTTSPTTAHYSLLTTATTAIANRPRLLGNHSSYTHPQPQTPTATHTHTPTIVLVRKVRGETPPIGFLIYFAGLALILLLLYYYCFHFHYHYRHYPTLPYPTLPFPHSTLLKRAVAPSHDIYRGN